MAQAAGFRWIKWARERRLKGPRQAVLLTIATHAGATGEAFLTYDTIAAESGYSRSSAMKAVKALEAEGYMSAQGTKGRRANSYRLGGSQLRLMDAPTSPAEPAALTSTPDPNPNPKKAFYNARNKKEETAALVDEGRAKGRELDGGRVAGLVKHHAGRSRGDVWRAFAIALETEDLEGCPVSYAEEILKNGRVPTPKRAPRGQPGTATDADLAAAARGDF